MIYYKNYNEIIKKKTDGYKIGKVCKYEIPEKKIEANISSFDDSTFNFHILYEMEEDDEIINQIQEARSLLINEIKKDDEIGIARSIKKACGDLQDNKPIYIYSMGNYSSNNIDPQGLEKYIAIYYENYLYMICFETLYVEDVDGDKYVNCILGKLQYYRCLVDDNKKMKLINIDEKGKFDCCYPKENNRKEEKKDGRKICNSNFTVKDISSNTAKGILELFKRFLFGKKMKTNNIDIISKETKGYIPGKVYIGKYGEQELDVYGMPDDGTCEPVIYDICSKNFHLIPKDSSIAERIAKSNGEIREKVSIELEKEISLKLDSRLRVKPNGDEGSKGGDKAQKGLFKYLPVYYNGKCYNINFMRFYIDKEKKVNCIFKQIQFDRTLKKYINEDLEKRGICYPTSYENHVSTLDKLIEQNKGKNFCYNPPVSYDDPKAIAEKFIEFIQKCEKAENKSN